MATGAGLKWVCGRFGRALSTATLLTALLVLAAEPSTAAVVGGEPVGTVMAGATTNATRVPVLWWSGQLVDPHGDGFTAISCPTSSFCAAIDGDKRALLWHGTSWSAPTTIDRGGSSDRVTSVSCASAAFCVAVDAGGRAITYDGRTWARPVTIDPGAVNASPGSTSVSCPLSTTFCVVADAAGNVVTYRHGSWGVPQHVDADALTSVTCTTGSFCVAVDGNDYLLTETNGKWGRPSNLDAYGTPSCVSSRWCMVAASNGVTAGTRVWDGRTWSPIEPMPGTTTITGLACPSTLLCVALDASGNTYVRLDGAWGGADAVGAVQGLLSCASTTSCMAVTDNGWAYTYRGAAWSAFSPVDEPSGGGGLESLSCPSENFCAATDWAGRWVTDRNGVWGKPQTVHDDTFLVSVSCASPNFCATIDDNGNGYTWNGRTWSGPHPTWTTFGAYEGGQISCPTTTTCVGEMTDRLVAYRAGRWRWLGTMPAGLTADGLACASATLCLLVAGKQLSSTSNRAYSMVFDGHGWSRPEPVGPVNELPEAVACPSTHLCIMTAQNFNQYGLEELGLIATWDGARWSAQTASPVGGPGPGLLSCSSTTSCIVAGGLGIAFGAPGRWGTANAFPVPEGLTGLACPTTNWCAAIDKSGSASTFRDPAPLPGDRA